MSEKTELLTDAEVEFLLNAAAAETAEVSAAELEGVPGREVTMRGDLEQINLADIFQTLAMSKMEGVLRVRNPLEERQIHCRDGFVRIHLPNRLQVRRLGQCLLHAGLIGLGELKAALVAQRTEKRLLGEVLVAQGSVTQEAIDELLARQTAEDLFALFTWQHGSFEFFKGPPSEGLSRALTGGAEYEISSLLLEVARRSDEWETIHETLGSLDEVAARVPETQLAEESPALHRTVWTTISGTASYREIAQALPDGLFDVARAARDLVRQGLVENIDDAAMLAVAKQQATSETQKRALLTLQCLRDRSGERAVDTLRGMATVLEQLGERRQAGSLLLAAAQRLFDSQGALDLARAARRLAPRDLPTLTFLRGLLVEHVPGGAAELDQITLDLLDAMVEANQPAPALEMIAAARAAGPLSPAMLQREVRARQRDRDLPGAKRVIEELAQALDARGETQQANEAWSALLRLDRSRKDVRKLLAHRRRTRFDRILRIVVAAIVLVSVAGMGVVWWREQTWATAYQSADRDITEMLGRDDVAGARARFTALTDEIGTCESTESLDHAIRNAETERRTKTQSALRQRISSALATASRHMDSGELRQALATYEAMAQEPEARAEMAEAASARLESAVQTLEQVGKGIASHMPPPPDAMLGSAVVLEGQRALKAACSPLALQLYFEIEALLADGVPTFLPEALRDRCQRLPAAHGPAFRRARELHAAYAEAVARNEHQRQLDPMFKAAQEREREHDFAGALERYRELERQPSNSDDLREHFRDRVARNATIVRLLDALQTATAAGDHATALQQLRALRLAFPEVPFAQMVRLPVHVRSSPSGAAVRCNGQPVGKTPMVLARHPADTTVLELELPGFLSATTTVVGEETSEWSRWLYLPSDRSWNVGKAVTGAPAVAGDSLLLTDRSGNLQHWSSTGERRWSVPTGDVSGLPSRPLAYGDFALVATLDGDLTAFSIADGRPAWTEGNLPTEVEPALIESFLFVADTRNTLHRIDLNDRSRRQCEIGFRAEGRLVAHGSTLIAIGENGRMRAFDSTTLETLWTRGLGDSGSLLGTIDLGVLVVVDERGRVAGIDPTKGTQQWQHALDDETIAAPMPSPAGVWVATRRHLTRFDSRTGKVLAAVAATGEDWRGPAASFGNRLLVGLQNGDTEVRDLLGGEPLYRLKNSRHAAVYAVASGLLVAEPDGAVQWFTALR